MNYEKKYKEALERAKKSKNNVSFNAQTHKVLDIIFPELKESEDEKIREMLIRIYKKADMGGEIFGEGITYKQVIAWLEKQGGNLVENGYTDNKDIIKYADNYSHEIWYKLMENFKNIKDYHIGCNDVSDIVLNAIIDAYNWLEKQGEQKPVEWKDSDEKYLFWALLSIQKDIAASEINGVNTKDLNDCVKWLYSLKQRIGG